VAAAVGFALLFGGGAGGFAIAAVDDGPDRGAVTTADDGPDRGGPDGVRGDLDG
jgi:hypothetical protein